MPGWSSSFEEYFGPIDCSTPWYYGRLINILNIYCLPVLQVDLAPRDLLDLIADLFDPVRPRDLSLLSIDQDSDNNHDYDDNHEN